MRTTILLAAVPALLIGAGWPEPDRATASPAPPRAPARLSETGLYSDMTALEVDPRNQPFSPQYPLWSDGAAKSRWIRLPEGSVIDVSDVDAWRFPVGTKLWKEFAFGGRRVETRLIWRATEDRWIFAAYAWNAEQTDADLAPEEGLAGVAEITPGKRHAIPSLSDCSACHEAGRSVVLGFNALQLSDDRDPLAPHAEPVRDGTLTLRSLVEAGLLEPPRPDLVERPPAIRASTPRARAAMGYLAGNCGHCHAASGELARLGLDLSHGARADAPPALASALDAASRYAIPGLPPEASRRIAPGDPARSTLLHRMRSRRPTSQMPPLGTVLPDEDAIRLVEGWIAEDLAPRHAASIPVAEGR